MIRRLTLGIGAATAAAAGAGWIIARRLTAPVNPRRFDLTIRDIEHDDDGDLIVSTAPTRPQQTASTTSGSNKAAGHSTEVTTLRATPHRAKDHGRSARPRTEGEVIAPHGAASYYATPHEAGLDARDITITTPQDNAWPGASTATLDLGHPHPRTRSTRAGTRGVLAATELGYTSLSSPTATPKKAPRRHRPIHLGHTETTDVDEAIGYAVRRGAQQIVLFGWSMGAAIALQLTDRPRHEGLIAGLVLRLASPQLDRSHQDKLHPQRTPSAAGYLAVPWLTIQPLARLAGLPGRIPPDPSAGPPEPQTSPRPSSSSTVRTTTPCRSSSHTPRCPPGTRRAGSLRRRSTLSWNTGPRPLADHHHPWLRARISG